MIDIRVPDGFRIHDHDRTFFAAIETSGLVDTDFALAGESERLDAFLCVLLHRERTRCRAAALRGVALIAAEKDVAPVIAHRFT